MARGHPLTELYHSLQGRPVSGLRPWSCLAGRRRTKDRSSV